MKKAEQIRRLLSDGTPRTSREIARALHMPAKYVMACASHDVKKGRIIPDKSTYPRRYRLISHEEHNRKLLEQQRDKAVRLLTNLGYTITPPGHSMPLNTRGRT